MSQKYIFNIKNIIEYCSLGVMHDYHITSKVTLTNMDKWITLIRQKWWYVQHKIQYNKIACMF